MPIREGKAKLWFNTKEEQDEFDDKMIASVQLQSMDFDDEHFSPVFYRKRQEFFLDLSDKAKSDLRKFKIQNVSEYIDRYHSGKRDHTFWREWTVHKLGVFYAMSYLFLRELPIRNFYARSWIIFAVGAQIATCSPLFTTLVLAEDQWNDKTIKNFGVYNDWKYRVAPTLDGRLPEEKLWQNSQPGYLKTTLAKSSATAWKWPLAIPKEKEVAWDGTWNMPLEGLANPKHKDAKTYDFIYE